MDTLTAILVWYAIGWIVPVVYFTHEIKLGRPFLVMDLVAVAGTALIGPISLVIAALILVNEAWSIFTDWAGKKCSKIGSITLIQGNLNKDNT